MKRILYTLLLVIAFQTAFGQCQALFTSYYDAPIDSLILIDQSFNTDSTPLTGVTYNYSVQYGGMTYTSTGTPYGLFFMNGYSGPVLACLTISTFLGCTSTYCDSIYINNGTPLGCDALFGYYVNQSTNVVDFYDASTPEYPWVPYTTTWTFTGGTPSTSTMQNPSVTFPGNGVYQVCLVIVTDSGCNDSFCQTVVINDSLPNNCTLSVVPSITNVTTIGGNDGFIDLTVTGGTPPYIYSWSNTATTQDIYGLSSGYYIVNILQSDTACPATVATFEITEPYDTIPLDTLYAPIIDTCLGYGQSNYFVNIVTIDTATGTATVIWTFQGGGMTSTFTTTYTFNTYGAYVIVLTINCDSSKMLTTYMTYVNFTPSFGVPENPNSDFKLYPNPFGERFEITMPGGIHEVMIYNNLGQLVWSTANNDTELLSIDAANWPAGFYMVRMQGATGKASSIVVKK